MNCVTTIPNPKPPLIVSFSLPHSQYFFLAPDFFHRQFLIYSAPLTAKYIFPNLRDDDKTRESCTKCCYCQKGKNLICKYCLRLHLILYFLTFINIFLPLESHEN